MTAPKGRGARVASPPDTPDIAVSLAKAGWPVFPVSIYQDDTGKRHKVPAVPKGTSWKDWATTDVETVRAAWAGEHRQRWIGVHAGAANIVVLDVDPGGDDSLAAAGLTPPDTFTYDTHRKGGRHHVYAAPAGIELTIARDLVHDGKPLTGIDVRSGSGLMVYYGPKLKGAPELAPAPDWLLVSRDAPRYRDGEDRDRSATEDAFRDRLMSGKAPKALRKLIRGVDFPDGAAHDPMLEAVAALVFAGVKGEPGIAALLDETRERYIGNHPDRPRDWENAVTGSVRRFGLPPATFELSKAERRDVAERNQPEAIEQRKKAAAREFVAGKIEALENDAAPDDVSDDAMAERFAAEIRGVWANTPGVGLLRYDGIVWQRADIALLVERSRVFCRVWRHDMRALALRRGGNKDLEAAAQRLGLRSTISSIANLAAGILLEDAPVLDRDPDLLNTPNVVVDLRTGETRERRWDDYFTKCTAVEYHAGVVSEDWEKALRAAPKKIRGWLQVRLGQAATGRVSTDKSVPFLLGGGDNGKSALIGGAVSALGTYAVVLPSETLLGADGAHPTELMTVMGARLAVVEELPRGGRINAQRMKLLAGTNKITARYMGKDFVTFPATHTLCVATNHLPLVTDVDDAIWERVAPVPLPYKFIDVAVKGPPQKGTNQRVGDPGLRDRLAEAPQPAVLAWLVAGAVRSYQGMMPKPKAVQGALNEWRGDSDPVLGFVRDKLTVDPEGVVIASDLYEEFGAYLLKRGQTRWSDALMANSFMGHSSLEGVRKRQLKLGPRTILSRPPFTVTTVPARAVSWLGIRFKNDGHVPSEAERDAATLADLERSVGG